MFYCWTGWVWLCIYCQFGSCLLMKPAQIKCSVFLERIRETHLNCCAKELLKKKLFVCHSLNTYYLPLFVLVPVICSLREKKEKKSTWLQCYYLLVTRASTKVALLNAKEKKNSYMWCKNSSRKTSTPGKHAHLTFMPTSQMRTPMSLSWLCFRIWALASS